MAGGELARPDLGAAQCRAAGADRRPDTVYPAGAGRDGRPGWSASSRRTVLNLIGGCCGTDDGPISRRWISHAGASAPVKAAANRRAPRLQLRSSAVWVPSVGLALRPGAVCARRTPTWSIGERCNANGSKQASGSCRRPRIGTAAPPSARRAGQARARTRWMSAPPIVGRDEVADMTAVVTAPDAARSTAPLVFDSAPNTRCWTPP